MKKILKQVLAVALIMTSILQLCVVPNTSAAVILADNDAVEEIELLSKLGFISKSYGPKKGEDAVTRAQFASILGYLRGFDENIINHETKFMDIPDDHWCAGQIYSLYTVGLISGTSVNTFSPNDLITYNEVVRCLVSLLGYDMQAERLGGYPDGYLTIATRLGVVEANSTNDAVDYETIAKLVVKALDTEVFELVGMADDGASLSKTKNCTLLNVYNDIYYDTGIMTDNGLTSLIDKAAYDANTVIINGRELNVSDTDISQYLGYKLKYYYRDVDGEVKLLFAFPYKTNVIELKDEDIDFDNKDYSFKTIYYEVDEKEKHCKIDDYVDVIYNGKAYPGFDLDTLKFKQGNMVLIDNDSDGDCDVIRVDEYYNMRIATIDRENEIIFGKHGEKIECRKFDRVDYMSANGKISTLGSFNNNQIVSVFESKDGEYVRLVNSDNKITAKVEYVENLVSKPYAMNESEIESFKAAAEEMRIFSGGNEYSLSYDYISNIANGYQGAIIPKLGLTYSFTLDVNGKIAAIESPSGDQYAYLIKVYYLDDSSELGEKTNARVLLQDGTLTTTVFAEKVTVNGVRYLGQTEGSKGVYNCPEFFKDGEFYKQAVKLRLNAAGEITEMETAREVTTNPYGYDSTKFTLCYDNSSKYGGHDQRSIDNSYSLPDDAIIFSIPPESEFNEDDLAVLTEKQLNDSFSTTWKLYDCDASWAAKLAVIQMSESTEWEGRLFIVQSTRTEVLEDDTVAKVVKGSFANSERTFYGYKDGIIPDDIAPGDICRVVPGVNNKLMNLEVIVSPSKQKDPFYGLPDDYEEWRNYYGAPYAASKTGVTLSFDGGQSIKAFVRNSYTYGMMYDMLTNEVQSAQFSDLVTTCPIMEDGTIDMTNSRDMVYAYYRNGYIFGFVIIKNVF